jgi:hypothetical protein
MILVLLGFIFLIIISGLLIFQEETTPFKESFSSNTVMVLLGDSIFKNESYVKSGLSVSEYLKSNLSSTYCYALNDSTIVDVYNQVEQIPLDYNDPNCSIFLSVGGNDILSNHIQDKESLMPIFIAYTKLIRSIKTKMDKSRLFLVNIYYPSNLKYSQYTPILVEWNKMIDDYAYESTNNISGVVRLNELFKEESDFTHEIEPSETGGLKIAEAILKSISN